MKFQLDWKHMYIRNFISYLYIEILPLPFNFLSFFIPKKKNLWLFGAWNGNAYADNVKYFFQYVLKNHPEIHAIWVTSNRDVLKSLTQKNVEVVYAHSIKAFLYSFFAHVAVCSHDPYKDINYFGFSKRTVVLQLWHGMPLKKLEDEVILKSKKKWVIRFILFTKKIRRVFFLKANNTISVAISNYDKKIFERFFSAPCIITGYPRNDILVKNENTHVYKKNNVKKVMYMPTFRGQEGSVYHNIFFSQEVAFDGKVLDDFLSNNNAELFVKLHPVDMERSKKYVPISNRIHIVEERDVYPLLSEIDILITDYSSVFFDFLLTLKPIIFAPFDYVAYKKKDRGFYFSYNKVTPGPKAKNWNDIMIFLKEYFDDEKKDIEFRRKIRNDFHKYKDRKSSQRIFEYVINL